MAFIGFTDGILSRYSTPSLTTVDQRGEAMGERAAEMLIQKVEDRFDEVDPTQFRTEVIPVQLIERESAVLGKPTKADG